MAAKHDNRGLIKSRRAFARHGAVPVQKLSSAIWGLFFKALAIALGGVIAVGGISVWGITAQLGNGSVKLLDSNGNPIEPPTAEDLKGPINVLLVGSDTREGQSKVFGTDKSTLADVIILLHVSANRKNAVALSFPRDLMVPWPACPSTTGGPGYLPQSMGQINATIANGGPGCTLLTVEKLTGVKIPYLAMINFKGVIEMSNAIGGVEVCVANDIVDEYTHLDLKKGEHVLQGLQALQFLRTRHGVGDGSDLSRISNQQVFLTSLVRKVRGDGILTDPIKLYALANAAVRNMTLSSSLADLGTMVAIAGALKDIPLERITFLQVPSRGGLPAPYSGRVMPIYEKADPIFEKLQKDEPLLIAKAQPGSGAVVATPAPTASASATPTPSPTATEDVLDDSYRGTNGSQTTCSG